MANKCDLCGKGRDVGHNVSHAKNRTQKVRKPNLHTHRMKTAEGAVKLRLCAKCKRLLKGPASVKSKAVVAA